MAAETALYADHIKVYPQKVAGRFRRIKWAVLTALLAAYYLAPWIRWDRGPDAPNQAILVDMPARRAYFFVIEIWPQEIYFLAGLLLLGALGLFLVTSYAGRLWCGYACPQTVWTDLFLWAERWIEGDRNARMRLDAAPWTAAKLATKTAKHAIWLLIALLTGGVWIAYFKDAPTLVREFFTGQASLTVYGFTALFTATTYLLAGWAREQVCTYMCPWPRFQSAMFDEDTLTVTYRKWRGEPRGKKPRDAAGWEGRGDCIDCQACVNVCPTGIDIRDGIQLECIDCGLCIDACDNIMDRVGRPRGLIAFDTEGRQAAIAEGLPPARFRALRLRPVLYAMLMTGIAALMVFQLTTRDSFAFSVLRDRNALFVTLANGDIRNDYTLRIHNKERSRRVFTLELGTAPDGARLMMSGRQAETLALPAEPDSTTGYHVHVRAPRATIGSETVPLAFRLTDRGTGESIRYEGIFRGPDR